MKKIATIIAAITFSVTVSYSQTLIGGFDFDKSFSDLALDGPASDSFVSFSFQDGPGNTGSATQFSGTDVVAGLEINSVNRTTGVNDKFGAGGSLLAQNLTFIDSTGGFFDFGVNNAGGDPFTDIEFRFGASITQAGTGGSTVGISYSLDGGTSFTSIGTELIDTLQSDNGQLVSTTDISGSVLGVVTNDITFRVDFTDIDKGVNFDNLQVSGTVVPEPSTYAAIFGAIALGFVIYRRRK